MDLDPRVFTEHRKMYWPRMASHFKSSNLSLIYSAVRETGIPNAIGARKPLPTELNLEAWEFYLGDHDPQLLDFVKYGFPMGYIGPTSWEHHRDSKPP